MFGCFRHQQATQMQAQQQQQNASIPTGDKDSDARRPTNSPLATAVPDLPSGAVHFKDVWYYTEQLSDQRARMASASNTLVQTWPGCDPPTFIRSFLKEQQEHINQFRARLNDWFLRNQVPFLSEERAIELLVNQTQMLSKKCTGPVKVLADQIRDSITNPDSGMQSYYDMEETIKVLQQDAISRRADVLNGIINDAAFAKLRLDLHSTPPSSVLPALRSPTPPRPEETKSSAPIPNSLDVI